MRTIPILICALVLATPAQANWHKVERAKAVAAAYWEATPDCPTIWTLKAETLPSYYKNPGPRWAMATDTEWCRVYVRTSFNRAATWTSFCTRYVHEWGHLLGHQHSDDHGDVMFHDPRPIPACLRR